MIAPCSWLEKSLLLRDTAATSACLLTAQNPEVPSKPARDAGGRAAQFQKMLVRDTDQTEVRISRVEPSGNGGLSGHGQTSTIETPVSQICNTF